MLTVKILGSGCANCKKLEAVAREAAAGAGDRRKLVSSGRIPTQAEIRQWMSA